ncbi:MAG: hypothetical protein JSS64_00565 [Bacteroidetes bacterium]|nr:hypothetical protein [Bacteroidota bacterium]
MDIETRFRYMDFNISIRCILCVVSMLSNIECNAQKIPKSIVRNFSICIPRNVDSINFKFATDGYYSMKEIEGSSFNLNKDTFDINIIFYKRGMLLYNFFDYANKYGGDSKKYLSSVYHGIEQDKFYKGFFWGVYKISNDTIIAQVIFNRGKALLASWDAREYKFLILNRTTLEFLKMETRSLNNPTKEQIKTLQKSMQNRSFLHIEFIHYDYIPPYDNSWLKKLDWIWCDKSKK